MIDPKHLRNNYYYLTARIEAVDTGAIGTAFFFKFTAPDGSIVALITNKHVLEDTKEVRVIFHEGRRTPEGPVPTGALSTAVFQVNTPFVVMHPKDDVDLCAIVLTPGIDIAGWFYSFFDEHHVPSQKTLETIAGIEDVYMVGYPIGLADQKHNLPLIRRGLTASHPAVPFQGLPIGLIDAACLPGSSGSPIILFSSVTGTPDSILLGIQFATPEYNELGTVEFVKIPSKTVAQSRTPVPTHLGLYVRAEEILVLKQVVLATIPAVWTLTPVVGIGKK